MIMMHLRLMNKNLKPYVLVLTIALLSKTVAHSQVLAEPHEIFTSRDSVIYDMLYVGEHEIVAKMNRIDSEAGSLTTLDVNIIRMNDEGTIQESTELWSGDEVNKIVWKSNQFICPDGALRFFLARLENGTAVFSSATINDDLSVDFKPFWETQDYRSADPTFYSYNTGVVVNKDNSVIITYPPDSLYHLNSTEGMRILKFDVEGNLVAERLLENYPAQFEHNTLAAPDSTGCRLIMRSIPESPVKYSCITLDGDLNTVSIKENVDELSYPFLSCQFAFVKSNPANGKTYSINTRDFPAMNGNPAIIDDIFMSAWDADFNQINYTWGLKTPKIDNGYILNSIGFDSENNVYMVAEMDQGYVFFQSLYVAYLDENLGKYGELYFHEDGSKFTICGGMTVCPEGGCLVSCYKNINPNNFIPEGTCVLKFPVEAILGIEEAHDNGLKVAIAYPNPGNGTLNIRTALKGATVEVYDLQGRMVAQQAVDGIVTAIATEDWPSGVYLWKVLQDGNLSESGKWVKE